MFVYINVCVCVCVTVCVCVCMCMRLRMCIGRGMPGDRGVYTWTWVNGSVSGHHSVTCSSLVLFLFYFLYVNNRRGDNNFIIAIKRTNSAVIATLQQSHEGLPKSTFLSQSSVESRD